MSDIRNSKYIQPIIDSLCTLKHATNKDLLDSLRSMYPDLSATTVHRITARLLRRGLIAEAPSSENGSKRFDIKTEPHDHFICTGCQRMRDLEIAHTIIPEINSALGGCRISGRLLLYGTCQSCDKK